MAEGADQGPAGTVLVFGSSGALGATICESLEDAGFRVVRVTRGVAPEGADHEWLTTADSAWAQGIAGASVTGVVWAGGANCANDLVAGSGPFVAMFEANVTYVVDTMATLISSGSLADDASLVVLGSVWEGLARDHKSAYITAKAAVSGLVRAASVDLGSRGIRVNAVLPGVVDTPMTRANLTPEQIDGVVRGTPLGRLVIDQEVAGATLWLLSAGSSGVTGVCLPVDGGWSYSHAM